MDSWYGVEWIVDAHGCVARSLRDVFLLKQLFSQIISDLHLHPVGEARWHQFPGNCGITGLCLLSESHLACHTFPEHGSLCLNVFCCRQREDWEFRTRLVELFGATSVSVRRIIRAYGGAATAPDADNQAALNALLGGQT